MPEIVEVHGLDEAIRWLEKLPADVIKLLEATMEASLSNLLGHFAYPPATRANQPRYGAYGRYYERGVGSAYKLKRDGSITQYHNSERLSARWAKDVSHYGPYTMVGRLGNTASYAPQVHSKAEQASFHAARGWQTVETAIAEETENIVALFERAIAVALKRL